MYHQGKLHNKDSLDVYFCIRKFYLLQVCGRERDILVVGSEIPSRPKVTETGGFEG